MNQAKKEARLRLKKVKIPYSLNGYYCKHGTQLQEGDWCRECFRENIKREWARPSSERRIYE